MGRRAWALAAFLAASFPSAASAKPRDPSTAQARALASEGADLLDDKQYAEALEKVTRAEELHHAPTHLALIGQAQEGLGKLSAAAATYERLVAEPLPRSSPKAFLDAQETGRQHLRALLARVPSLLVAVHGLAPGDDAEARVDGEPFDLRSSTAMRVDPGAHVIRVTAQGYAPFEKAITLPERGGVTVVDAPLERPATATPPPSTSTSTSTPTSTPPATPPATPTSTPPAPPPRMSSSSLFPAFVAFGAGAVGLGVGAVTGILSLSNVSDLRSKCPGDRCTTAQQSEIDSTKTLGTVSTIAFVIGAAGAAAGVVLLVWRPGSGHNEATKATSFEPWIGAGSGGVRGRF